MRHRHHDDDDVLRDGEIGHCSMRMRDAVTPPAQRGERVHMRGMLDIAPPRQLHDGRGNLVGHRPGYIIVASNNRDEIEEAYRLRDEEDRNAWRHGPVHDGRKVVQRDPAGRLLSTFEEEREDDDELHDASTRGGMTLDEAERVHRQLMAREYEAYDNWIQQQWRNR